MSWLLPHYQILQNNLNVVSKLLRSFPGVIWNQLLLAEGRERAKKASGHSRLVGSRLMNKGTYSWGLPWATERQVHLCSCLSNLKNLCRGLNWVQSYITSQCSKHHITTWRLCPWGGLWGQRRKAEPKSQGRGKGEKSPGTKVHPAYGSTAVSPSLRPPPTEQENKVIFRWNRGSCQDNVTDTPRWALFQTGLLWEWPH